MMKKIIYLFAVIGLIFASACDPMEDINAEIDAVVNPIVGDAIYTLTDEDYSDLDLGYGSFSSLDDAKAILPTFLAEKYFIWGKGSSVLVGYKLYVGSAPGVSDYTYADDYRLANADYPQKSIGATGFFPDEDPADFLTDVLAANVADAAEGDNILVKHKQYVGTPVPGYSNYFETDFIDGTLGAFEAISVVGDQVWGASNYGAKMSGYSGGSQPNEDWLISPVIDLSDQANLLFQTSLIANYSTQIDLLKVLVSLDYTTGGDPNAATWEAVALENVPSGTNWDPVLSEDYDFSAYEGKVIHVAFKYESTSETSATWEVENVVIKAAGVEGETINKEVFYTLSGGEWEEVEGVYFLSDADFDSMGESYGQPGYYNNFGSTMPPDDYVQTFLNIKYPYALDDDKLIIVYDYYSSSSGAQLRGNLYTAMNGEWSAYQSTQNTTLQFAHDGNVWVPDNTIKYTLTGADYSYIVATFTSKYPSETANMASFGNFNGYSWTPEMILEAVNAVLLHNNPSAAEGQKYALTYSIYDGTTHDDTIYLILEGGEYVLQ